MTVKVILSQGKKKFLTSFGWHHITESLMNYFGFVCTSISMTHDESKPWWSFSVHGRPVKQVSCLRYLTYCSAAVFFTRNRFSRAFNASAGLGKQIEHARWCNVVCAIEHLWWTVAWSGATTSASLCAGRVNKAAFSCHGFRLWQRAGCRAVGRLRLTGGGNAADALFCGFYVFCPELQQTERETPSQSSQILLRCLNPAYSGPVLRLTTAAIQPRLYHSKRME